jgi:hypothetical protein
MTNAAPPLGARVTSNHLKTTEHFGGRATKATEAKAAPNKRNPLQSGLTPKSWTTTQRRARGYLNLTTSPNARSLDNRMCADRGQVRSPLRRKMAAAPPRNSWMWEISVPSLLLFQSDGPNPRSIHWLEAYMSSSDCTWHRGMCVFSYE